MLHAWGIWENTGFEDNNYFISYSALLNICHRPGPWDCCPKQNHREHTNIEKYIIYLVMILNGSLSSLTFHGNKFIPDKLKEQIHLKDEWQSCRLCYTVWLLCSFLFISMLKLKEFYICQKKDEFIIRRGGSCSFSEFSSAKLEQESQGWRMVVTLTSACGYNSSFNWTWKFRIVLGVTQSSSRKPAFKSRVGQELHQEFGKCHCSRMSWMLSARDGSRASTQWYRESSGSSALLINNWVPTSKQNTFPVKHSRKMNILFSPCHF